MRQLCRLIEQLPYDDSKGEYVTLGGVLILLYAFRCQPAYRQQRVAMLMVLPAVLVLAEGRIGDLNDELAGDDAVARGQVSVGGLKAAPFNGYHYRSKMYCIN